MIPAAIMAVMGKLERNGTWTLPIRDVWMCGAYFYGHILARRWRSDGTPITKGLLPVTLFLLLLATVGLFNHKIRFILVPLAIPCAWYAWRQGTRVLRLQAVAAMLFASSVGLGLRVLPAVEMGGAEEGPAIENLGIGGSTLTFNLLILSALGLTLLTTYGHGRIRRFVAMLTGLPAFFLAVGFSVTVAVLGPRFWGSDPVQGEHRPISERIREKVFDDRSVIWNAALNDALRPPLILKPSGEPLLLEGTRWGDIVWEAGAHNSILNTLMRQRWLNGPILLLLLAVAMRRNSAAMARPQPSGVDALSIAVAVTGVFGVGVADYPLNVEGGFWFFGFAGIAAGWVVVQRRLALTTHALAQSLPAGGGG
jgi:hypothetical protein